MSEIAEQASHLLEEIRELLVLNGENPFKVRAYERAQDVVAACPDLKERAQARTLTELEGIGKGISEILTEFLLKGTCALRDDLRAKLPQGVLELTQVPGLGPKKALQLIEELDIHSVAELEYACRENRLLTLKGFGEKLQAKVLDGIQFLKSTQDQARLVDAWPMAQAIEARLRKTAGKEARVELTGALRRRLEVVDRIEFLIEEPERDGEGFRKKMQAQAQAWRTENHGALAIELHFAQAEYWGYELARTTGSDSHWQALGHPKRVAAPDEKAFYQKLKHEWIPPEFRETGEEVQLFEKNGLKGFLAENGVQGVFHNHTTRSDGTATLEEMVKAALKLGYKYIGISDHSQTAVYAHGLKADDLKAQEKEIKAVQEKYPAIRIFWGVESDILADGELDYPASLLKRFDFVIASVHSRFKMDREQMSARILKAIRNPYTRFVGHLTGRLLLGRPGYELETDRIIAEAAKCDVAIEINANPARLDIDWRWGPALRSQKTWVSVNPDAHEVAGLQDTAYGVTVARKALLPEKQILNALPVSEVEKWLSRA